MTTTSNRYRVSIEADPTVPIIRMNRDFTATTAELPLQPIDEGATSAAPASAPWAIPAAREAEAPEQPARRLLVAGLNPVARLGGAVPGDPRSD